MIVAIFILVNFSNIYCVVLTCTVKKNKKNCKFVFENDGFFFFKLWMDKVQTRFKVYWWVLHNQEHYISWWIVLDQIWQIVKNNKGILNSLLPVKSVSKMDHYSKGVIFQCHEVLGGPFHSYISNVKLLERTSIRNKMTTLLSYNQFTQHNYYQNRFIRRCC